MIAGSLRAFAYTGKGTQLFPADGISEIRSQKMRTVDIKTSEIRIDVRVCTKVTKLIGFRLTDVLSLSACEPGPSLSERNESTFSI